jgi:integrase
MNNSNAPSPPGEAPRPARNKGKLTGPKPPLRPGHVWSIRAKLQLERRVRDLALFNLAIDSKLRGCDLVALRIDDVAPNGYAVDRATVRQSKTGRPVRFELTEVTRNSLDDYLRAMGRGPGQCLFPGRRGPDEHLTTRQYARLVSEWVLCHEHRRSTRRCATVLEMKEGPSGSAIRSPIPSHRERLWPKAMVVSIAEKPGR